MSTTSTSTNQVSTSAAIPTTFSIEHYEHMIKCGAFAGEYQKNVELLWGRFFDMTPIDLPHEDNVDFLTEWSVRATLDQPIRVRIQNSIRLPQSQSAPEPDICWVRERDYSKRAPFPEDILLLIEVADSSLETDRTVKLAAYAQASIQDYWIVNLVDKQVEVYREPSGLKYTQRSVFQNDQTVSPLSLPTANLRAGVMFEK